MVLEWTHNDKLCTEIFVDFTNKKVNIKNYTDFTSEKAFGVNESPDYNDFEFLLERRCFSQNASMLKLRLKEIGLNYYNPLDIISKTNGQMAEDNFALTITEE